MMKFIPQELVAIYKVAEKMVWADGVVQPEELVVVENAMRKAGTGTLEELNAVKEDSKKMSDEDCYGIIAFLDVEQKMFVSSLLGAISSSDGDIDDRELKLWRDICDKCDLPIMNNRQAISIFNNF